MLRRSTPTIRRLYQTWIGPGKGLSKDEMIVVLDGKRAEVGEEEMDRMTAKIIREMLSLDNPD
jgi:hypothetical protein